MHKLNDQWVEIIDGQEHMVKAVEGIDCKGCMLGSRFVELVTAYDGYSEWHEYDHVCSLENCPFNNDELAVKDLGILKDGLLPCPFCREYPEILMRDDYNGKLLFYIEHDCNSASIETQGYYILQELKDTWNRRG